MTPDPTELRHRLVDELAVGGKLAEPWREAFLAVPRHAFIPELVWRHEKDIAGEHDLVPLRREDDPVGWLEWAYRNGSVATQIDDGHPTGEELTGWEISSSASMPTVVAEMLVALDAEPGMSVLEIGTGTGYNAALLAHRLGADNITSLEVDPAVAEHARTALSATGYGPVTVITGDGAHGHLPRAPYDRVLSTAMVRTVPHPWVTQTRLGGRIVTPWGTPYRSGLLALTVTEPGRAVGGIVGEALFMWLREQRIPRFRPSVLGDKSGAVESSTELHPYHVTGNWHAATAIGIRVPRCQFVWIGSGDGGTLWLVDQWSRSWASLHVTDGGSPYTVRQSGTRTLWDDVEAAHRWWVEKGKPAVGDWRFTVTADRQQIELVD